MLRKKDIRKKAHHLIRKDKKDHQTTYDLLKKEKSDCPKEEVANIVSKIPDDDRNRKTMGLRIFFVICMSFIFLLRLMNLVSNFHFLGVFDVVIFLFHGLTLPFLGIYGALTGRTRFYKFIAVFMILSSVFNLIVLAFFMHWLIIALSLPFIAAAVLGFILPAKLRVPYEKKMVQRELRGRTVNVYEYYFKERNSLHAADNQDLLDI